MTDELTNGNVGNIHVYGYITLALISHVIIRNTMNSQLRKITSHEKDFLW